MLFTSVERVIPYWEIQPTTTISPIQKKKEETERAYNYVVSQDGLISNPINLGLGSSGSEHSSQRECDLRIGQVDSPGKISGRNLLQIKSWQIEGSFRSILNENPF